MRVRLTQIIDFWIGVPLCFIFSIINCVARFFSWKKESEVKRILFIELSEMGSAIIAYSSLVKAKSLFPGVELYFLIFAKNRESVELLGVIPKENIITISEDSFIKFGLGTLKALFKIRSLKIDTVIDMELFSRVTTLISFLTGASRRIGFYNYTAEGLYRGSLLTHKVFYNTHQHMVLNFLSLVHVLKADIKELPLLKENTASGFQKLPCYKLDEKEENRISELLENKDKDYNLVLFNPDPGEALPIRGWGLNNFIDVAKKLVEADSRILIVVIGLPKSKYYAQKFIDDLPKGRCLDLTGKTKSIAELIGIFSISDMLIGNDSGPAHFAALTDISIITLFGPETPALYGPLSPRAYNFFSDFACSPCLSAANHRHTICKDSKCLKAISVDSVASKALLMLKERGIFN